MYNAHDNDMPAEQPQYWYFTFGFRHAHPNGYVRIYGTHDEARAKMVQRFATKWAFQYDELTFSPQIAEYNLYEVHVD